MFIFNRRSQIFKLIAEFIVKSVPDDLYFQLRSTYHIIISDLASISILQLHRISSNWAIRSGPPFDILKSIFKNIIINLTFENGLQPKFEKSNDF